MATTTQPTIDDLSVASLRRGYEALGHSTAIKALLALRHSSEPKSIKDMAAEFEEPATEVGRIMRSMVEGRYARVARKSEKAGVPENFYALTPQGNKLYDKLMADSAE